MNKEWYIDNVNKIILGLCLLVLLTVIEVSFIQAQTIQQSTPIELIQTCNNCTYCNITKITNQNGTFLRNLTMQQDGTSYNYTLNSTYTQVLGLYDWWYTCGNSNDVATGYITFDVTTSGNQNSLVSIIFYIAGLGVLIIFLGLCFYSFVKFDNLLNRVGMIGIAYLIFIAISFISWQMCLDFLTQYSFITQMMNITFIVLFIGAIPLFIGGLIFYLYMLSQIKEINNYMKKGMSQDEAEERVKHRRKK